MEIQSTLLSAPLPTNLTQLKLTNWLVGQILTATVTGRSATNTLQLQINNQLIEAKTQADIPVNIGQQIKLVVEKGGNPALLRLVQHDVPKLLTEIRQQLIRENLPKQANLDNLGKTLSFISSNAKEVLNAFPLPVQKQIQKLIEQLPTQSSLKNGSNLETTIKDSGLFLESKLFSEVAEKPANNNLQQTAPQNNVQIMNKDFKANLLQLAEFIAKYKSEKNTVESNIINKPSASVPVFEPGSKTEIKIKTLLENTHKLFEPGEKINVETLSKLIESSIARIEVNQSKAIVTQDNPVPVWSIELPVKDKQNIDLLKLDVQADKNHNKESEPEKIWTVNLNINFENIGIVSARVSMAGKEINATLWSNNKPLNDLINEHLAELGTQIEKCGLHTGKIQCLDREPEPLPEPVTYNNLININV